MKQLVSEFCNKELKRLICFKEQVKTFSRGVTFLGKRSISHITTSHSFTSKFRLYEAIYRYKEDSVSFNFYEIKVLYLIKSLCFA